MNINNAFEDVLKKELEKYKTEHYIYKQRLAKYEALNIPPTDEEKQQEMLQRVFKKAYKQEQINKNSDIEKVDILLKRLTKPIFNPYLSNVINHLETLISKIEEKESINKNDERLQGMIKKMRK
jgi:hypothetical protein